MSQIEVEHRNLGTINKNCVTIRTDKGQVDLYFSYNTIVAVDNIVSQNIWSKTTGKLLNDLEPNKDNRKEYDLVLKEVEKRLKNLFYSQKEQIAEELIE